MAAVIPRGCTAVNAFKYPYSKDETEVLYITYKQAGKTALEFKYDEEEPDDTIAFDEENELIRVYLTQEDTLAFKSKVNVEIQIRVRFESGDAAKSNIVRATVDTILKGGVI